MAYILITGGSWFIGQHLAKKLLQDGENVIVFDRKNSSDIYQEERKRELWTFPNFQYIEGSLEKKENLEDVFKKYAFSLVYHLAAKTGVRNGGKDNDIYFASNVIGFFHILELSKEYKVPHFIFASSSSIYGGNTKTPFSVEDKTDSPLSFYAATKKSNELFAYSYHKLYGMNITGFRFFTVYGPLGRNDMMMDIFTRKILKWETIDVHNNGKMKRDFTHVSDIVNGLLLARTQKNDFQIYNLGNDSPVSIEYVIEILEKEIGKKALRNYKEMEIWEVVDTWADIAYTREKLGWNPKISIEEGIRDFVEQFKKNIGI